MAKKKVPEKNVNVSVSISSPQKRFIDSHPRFNFSKFVQIHLQDYIDLSNEYEQIKRREKNGRKKTVN